MYGDYGPGDAPGSYGSDYGPGDAPADAGGGGGPSTADYNSSFDFSNYSDEASGLSAGAYSKDVAQAIADMLGAPLGEGAATGRGFHSPGVGYGTLAGLQDAGFGKMDIPGFTQNIEQALAAQNVHNVLNYAAPAFAGLIPGYGTVSALGKGIANIHGLMTGRLSAKDVVPGLAAGLIGARTGIPSGILEGIFTGDLGKTVGSGAQAGLGALVSGITGNPMAGALASSTLGTAVGRAASEAVGGSKAGGSGGPFGGAAPNTSQTITGNAYGDSGAPSLTEAILAEVLNRPQEPKQPAWSSQMTAGRYGPLMEYEFGA